MRKKKTKVKFQQEALFTEVNNNVQDLLTKFGITNTTSKTVMVQKIRAYIDGQSNPIRTCNAILIKLGVPMQINNEARKARVYAMTALDEALRQGPNFDPKTVLAVADARLIKIEALVGRDTEVVSSSEESSSSSAPSKAEIARQIYAQHSEEDPNSIVERIAKKLKLEKQSARNYYYSAKRALTI